MVYVFVNLDGLMIQIMIVYNVNNHVKHVQLIIHIVIHVQILIIS